MSREQSRLFNRHFPLRRFIETQMKLAWLTGANGLIGNYLVQIAPRFAPCWHFVSRRSKTLPVRIKGGGGRGRKSQRNEFVPDFLPVEVEPGHAAFRAKLWLILIFQTGSKRIQPKNQLLQISAHECFSTKSKPNSPTGEFLRESWPELWWC